MKRINLTIGGVRFPPDNWGFIHPPLRFDGWQRESKADDASCIVASIAENTVVVPLDEVGELIEYLQRFAKVGRC